MKKVYFNEELKNSLKNLRKSIGQVTDGGMSGVTGGGGCGAVCKNSCSLWCRSNLTTQSRGDRPACEVFITF